MDKEVVVEGAAARAATIGEIADAARSACASAVWDFIEGGAESETTARRNRERLERLALRPRVLVDVSSIDTAALVAGLAMRIPVLLAPLGSLQSVTPDGALAAARAAERFGTPVMVSSTTEPDLPTVAAGSGGAKIAQLYIRGDERWAEQQVDAIVAAGYGALALTVDLAYYGRRERQLRSGWRPASFTGDGEPGRNWQAKLDWEWAGRLRDRAGLPFVIKGIQSAADAERAVEFGAEVIYVSNHGGRQLDHGEASIDVLRDVADAVAGRAQIVMDGGVRRGTDVLKAIALGADAVGIGRLQAYALAAGGEQALVRLLEILEDEIRVTMGLLGVTRLDQLDRSFVATVA
ncbi:MAG TPA: alpha-hydroxy acid oxidase [Solirubrobacteraceae bacterium]|nr:alpha-hydroxy acid oxidase [Solirubrobacteraceae bacterium]